MSFAADAVIDVIAPPARAPGRPDACAPAADGEQTFDEHLETASAGPTPEAPNEDRYASAETTPGAKQDKALDTGGFGDASGNVPANTVPPVIAPVMVQLAAAHDQSRVAQAEAISAPTVTTPTQAATQPPASTRAQSGQIETATAQTSAGHNLAPGKPTGTATAGAQPAIESANVQANARTQAAPQATQAQTQAAPQATQAQTQPASVNTTAPSDPIIHAAQQTQATSAAAPVAAEAQPPPKPLERMTAKVEKTSADASAKAVSTTATAHVNTKTRPAAVAANLERATPALADTAEVAQQPLQPATTSATTSQASSHVQHAASDHGAARAAPAATQVAQEIVRRFSGGSTRFELRLDPPELGRVEVRMEVSRDHRVTAVIAADSPQALNELSRHARDLEAQLQAAGLELTENGLSFDLRQGAQGKDTQDTNADGGGEGPAAVPAEQQQAPQARPIGFERWRGVRVDMMV